MTTQTTVNEVTVNEVQAVQAVQAVQPIKTLLNGVEVYALNINSSYSEAQEILDESEVTEEYDAEECFTFRVENNFCGTYKFKVQREGDFKEFINVLNNDAYKEAENLKQVIYNEYNGGNGTMSRDEAISKLNEIDENMRNSKKNVFRKPTIEEWKTGKYKESEKRELRLGKVLSKNGFSQSVVDFYSQQVKTEKVLFLTISDRVQHIAGMSNYVDLEDNEKNWDGYNNSSCQDTRHGYSECYQLAGSLYDNKLFIAMMHEKLEDVDNMYDCLLARTMMRYVTIEGKPVLLATSYYGNNKSKSELAYGLKQLHEVDIYEQLSQEDKVEEQINGVLQVTRMEEIYLCDSIETEVDVTCPHCDGEETITASTNNDDDVSVTCPCCNGNGEVTAYVSQDWERYEEVEVKGSRIYPYVERYNHHGSSISIWTDVDFIKKERAGFDSIDYDINQIAMDI